jgi:hypothetical protein
MNTDNPAETGLAAPSTEDLLALTARQDPVAGPEAASKRDLDSLPPAARRALAEAEERRRKAAQQSSLAASPKEIGGRGGADPARYGDWEIDGRAIDF